MTTPTKEQIEGQQFGRIKVLSFHHKDGNKYFYLCKCSCGNEKVIEIRNLKSGHTKSCGCLHKEIVTTHGMGTTRLCRAWHHIKYRCYNKTYPKYDCYGGRGIKVCDEWKNDFMSFYNWSISNGYSEDLTLDRIDPNGNYEPANCRWVTMKEQNRNRRDNKLITYEGITKCIADWADILGVKSATLRQRLRYGWTVERAFTEKIRNSPK